MKITKRVLSAILMSSILLPFLGCCDLRRRPDIGLIAASHERAAKGPTGESDIHQGSVDGSVITFVEGSVKGQSTLDKSP